MYRRIGSSLEIRETNIWWPTMTQCTEEPSELSGNIWNLKIMRSLTGHEPQKRRKPREFFLYCIRILFLLLLFCQFWLFPPTWHVKYLSNNYTFAKQLHLYIIITEKKKEKNSFLNILFSFLPPNVWQSPFYIIYKYLQNVSLFPNNLKTKQMVRWKEIWREKIMPCAPDYIAKNAKKERNVHDHYTNWEQIWMHVFCFADKCTNCITTILI